MSTPSIERQDALDECRVTRERVAATYWRGLLDLVYEAATVHRRCHDPETVQCASLLSVKTGGCSEDCAYCPQSAHYDASVDSTELMSLSDVVTAAERAKVAGADRFCMGAAWPQVYKVLLAGRWKWCSLSSGLHFLAWAAPRVAPGCRRVARTVRLGAPEALPGCFFDF